MQNTSNEEKQIKKDYKIFLNPLYDEGSAINEDQMFCEVFSPESATAIDLIEKKKNKEKELQNKKELFTKNQEDVINEKIFSSPVTLKNKNSHNFPQYLLILFFFIITIFIVFIIIYKKNKKKKK